MSLTHLQRLDYLVEGRLCGNTGISKDPVKVAVECQADVFGRYLVLQVSKLQDLNIGEVGIMVKNMGILLTLCKL